MEPRIGVNNLCGSFQFGIFFDSMILGHWSDRTIIGYRTGVSDRVLDFVTLGSASAWEIACTSQRGTKMFLLMAS